MKPNFTEMLKHQWSRGNFVCVGLDPKEESLPSSLRNQRLKPSVLLIEFFRNIIDATADIVCAYKPNAAFFEQFGTEGAEALSEIMRYIRRYSNVPIIYDAKRADIGSTNVGYTHSAFSVFGADAITINPYFGRMSLEPFLEIEDKGIIILCRTSNPGAGEFQDLIVKTEDGEKPLYQVVAKNIAEQWNVHKNCLLVVGATRPDELKIVREIVGDMPLLIPGIGAQGGDLEATVQAGKDSRNQGMIINSSRGIIYASSDANFAEVARRETLQLNEAIQNQLK